MTPTNDAWREPSPPHDMEEQRARIAALFEEMVRQRGHPMRAWFTRRNRNRKLALAYVLEEASHLLPRSLINYVHDSQIEPEQALPFLRQVLGNPEKKTFMERMFTRNDKEQDQP